MRNSDSSVIRFFKHYLAGMLASAWNGAIGAVAGIGGIDGAAMTGIGDVQVLSLHSMGAAFAGAFVIHGIFWLKAHPLPEDFQTNSPFFPAPVNPGAQPPSLPNQ